MDRSRVNLDDTSNCPSAGRCESCGKTTDLHIVTLQTAVGVYCATACTGCLERTEYPTPTSWSHACERVGEHCVHLGIDLDLKASGAVDDQAYDAIEAFCAAIVDTEQMPSILEDREEL